MKVRRVTPASGKNFIDAIEHLKNQSVKVGWFANSQYEDGTPVAEVAAQNEFGNPAKNIPTRSFMRTTIIEKSKSWQKIGRDGAKKVLKDEISISDVMGLIGAQAEGDIKKKIKSIYDPPLSPITIQRRLEKYKNKSKVGSLTKPLIDTGIMLNTLTHELSDD